MGPAGPSQLEILGERTGREFPNLLAARERTEQRLDAKRPSLEARRHDPDTSIVLMGSWGRRELTSGSDDDFMVLVRGGPRLFVNPTIRSVKKVLDRAPGKQGVFGRAVFSKKLVNEIGLDADDNSNLTRRMLFILESVPATAVSTYRVVREEILDRYLDHSVKPYKPPRFLLNDVRGPYLRRLSRRRHRRGTGVLPRGEWMPSSDTRRLSFFLGLLPPP